MKRIILMIAGEDSGDLHGSALIEKLKMIDPEIEIVGIGGERMKAAGMTLYYHTKEMAFLGFAEVLKHIPFIRSVQKLLLQKVSELNIKEVVLIDYPGFNLSIAKKLKKNNLKLVYYISPQIWAWGKKRIKKIKELIDLMIVVFPFEKDIYESEGINVKYVGHPLVERIKEYKFLSKDELFQKLKLDVSKDILLLMPGSREQEIKKIFPESIKAAYRLAQEFNMQIVVACSQNIDNSLLSSLSGNINYAISRENNYDLLKYAKFGIIKSGTSTLEAGLFRLPFIVVYSTNYLTYLIGKKLIKLPGIALANIVLGEKVVEELIQKDVNSQNIYNKAKEILGNRETYNRIKNKLADIKVKLGESGASQKAAEFILHELTK